MKKKMIAFINHRYVSLSGSPVCGSESLPETDFDFCDPTIAASEIQRIFIRRISSTDFTDISDPIEWTSRMSETSTDADAIRVLTVIADKPAPAATTKDISNGRKVITQKVHTINYTIDDVSAANHALIQFLETGKRFKVNYETAGGFMFGGPNSIVAEITGDMVLARGAGEIQVYQGTITWTSSTTENRIQSPIFGETVLGSDTLDTSVLFATDATPTNGECDFILAGGVSAVARFDYNTIDPTFGPDITMLVKIATVLKLTANMPAEYEGMPFVFKDIAGVTHYGIITDGDVNF